MNVNLMFIPTVILTVLTFLVGYRLMPRLTGWLRGGALLLAALLAVPAVVLSTYYLHWFDNAQWFYEFRTLPYSELSAAGIGVLVGMLQALVPKRRGFLTASFTGTLCFLLVWVMIPYAKMLVSPANPRYFLDTWEDGVCMQSTGSSCGPASAATLLKAAGVAVSERQLARESFTTASGTEIWYLVRAMRRHGCSVRYLMLPPSPSRLPCPAIAGTRIGGSFGGGHFIAMLGETPDHYIIGDPLRGKVTINKVDLSPYYFTGFFVTVTHAGLSE